MRTDLQSGRRNRRLRVAVLSVTAAVTAVATACVPPPAPTFSLAGEVARSEAPALITSGTCNPEGESTFTITSSGEAVGPYPGTFVETITVTLGPQDEEFPPGQFRGQVTSLESNTLITSPAGNVSARSTLDAGAGFAIGGCATSAGPAVTMYGQINALVRYNATKGTAVASGKGSIEFNMYDGDCSCSGGYQFTHDFYGNGGA